MGNKGIIAAGDIQWKRLQELMEPRYREIKNEDVKEVLIDKGIKIRVISGELGGIKGPVRDLVDTILNKDTKPLLI